MLLAFLILYIICFLLLDLEKKQYDKVLTEKQKIERALIKAMKSAGEKYEEVIHASEEKRKNTLEDAFFESLYITMGLLEEKEKREQLKMYLPMLILAEEDGAFFYYMEEKEVNSVTELQHLWSDKILYSDEADSSVAQKKSLVAKTLEKTASEIITNHNYIASQYGISYSFYTPEFLQNTSSSLEFPMLLCVFQGWPLTENGQLYYENCLDTGIYIQKIKHYVITGPQNLSDTRCRYHTKDCGLSEAESILAENISEKEAISRFGAYPCEVCIP